ncbi:MAG: S1 RNA-binding domain-containing protein [Microthrixaceae bacterium]
MTSSEGMPQVPPAPSADPHIADPHAEHEPAVTQVTLASLGEREVLVKMADGRTGVIERADYDDAQLGNLSPGDLLAAAVLQREHPDGRVPMSARWAALTLGWARVLGALESREPLTGRIDRKVKGGYVVALGVRAFLPQSLLGEVDGDEGNLVGTDVRVLVKEADRATDRVVVSRRDVQRRELRASEREQLRSLSAGQRHDGVVVEILDIGAKVRIGEVVGLVHRSELSWGHLGHPSEAVSVGDGVTVEVLEVLRSKRRVSLSLRNTLEHPLDSVEVGETYAATIDKVLEYGAIASLDGTGASGLVHVSELSEMPGQRPDQLVFPGEQIRVKVLSVDKPRNRMSLSAVQATWI